MKNKRNIYCDYQFWEAFFDLEEQILHDRSKRKLWDAFFDFLSSNNVYFNISKQDVNEDSNGGKNLKEISRKKGGAGLFFASASFPQVESLSDTDDNLLNSVFLTMLDVSECKLLSNNFGVMVFNLPMIFSAKHVYVDNGIAFYKTNGQNWSYLMALNEKQPSICCCNSLVISDRYLLYDQNESSIDTNLKPIFEAFLPDSLYNDIYFTICIIAEYNTEKCNSINEKTSKLEDLIRSLRPKLKFKLNIYHSWLHDRSILTNNVILTSGAGFDVIGTDDIPLKFTTTSLCFPFLQNNSDNSLYLDWINNVLIKKRMCKSYQVDYWGEKNTRHHLLDYYYEEPRKITSKQFDLKANMRFNGFAGTETKAKFTIGIFRKGEAGSKSHVIQQETGYVQQVRTIRNGESLNDGDNVEYILNFEPNFREPTKKFWFAEDVHLKK